MYKQIDRNQIDKNQINKQIDAKFNSSISRLIDRYQIYRYQIDEWVDRYIIDREIIRQTDTRKVKKDRYNIEQ